jgi:hypothetical protein
VRGQTIAMALGNQRRCAHWSAFLCSKFVGRATRAPAVLALGNHVSHLRVKRVYLLVQEFLRKTPKLSDVIALGGMKSESFGWPGTGEPGRDCRS